MVASSSNAYLPSPPLPKIPPPIFFAGVSITPRHHPAVLPLIYMVKSPLYLRRCHVAHLPQNPAYTNYEAVTMLLGLERRG